MAKTYRIEARQPRHEGGEWTYIIRVPDGDGFRQFIGRGTVLKTARENAAALATAAQVPHEKLEQFLNTIGES